MSTAHVVVIPLPVHGHLNPLLQLSAKLASLGVNVSFITTSSTLSKATQTLHAISQQEYSGRVFENVKIWSVFDENEADRLRTGDLGGVWQTIFFMGSKSTEIERIIYNEAVPALGDVSCFILDLLVVMMLRQHVCKPGIPNAVFWTSSSSYLLVSLHTKSLVEQGHIPFKDGEKEDSTIRIQGLPELSLLKDMPYTMQEAHPDDPNLAGFSMTRKLVLESSCIILNTFVGLETEPLYGLQQEGVNILPVGPLVPMSPELTPTYADSETERIFTWLSSKPPSSVIYVCFGTLSLLGREQVTEVAYGLGQSGCNFLWILRERSLPEGFEQRISQRGLISGWCPQLEVLRHPSIGAFLTHCGWNSILESLTSGVPMLGWPCMAEQNLNCKYMADVWKVGRRVHTKHKLQKEVIYRDHIETEVRSIMGNGGGEFRKRALEWREAARRAVQSGGPSNTNLKELAQALKGEVNAVYMMLHSRSAQDLVNE